MGWLRRGMISFFKCVIPNCRFVTLVCAYSGVVLFEFLPTKHNVISKWYFRVDSIMFLGNDKCKYLIDDIERGTLCVITFNFITTGKE